MPLMILGLIVLIGILIYAIARYINSDESDSRPVRVRYPHIFQDAFRGDSENGRDEQNEYGRDHESAEGSDDDVVRPEVRVYTDDIRGDLDHLADDIKDNLKRKAKQFGFDTGTITKYGRGGKAESDQAQEDQEDDDDPIIFPTENVEEEKKKRNIH